MVLLSKPIIAFLHANRTPQVHTLIVALPNGRILAYSSQHAAAALRAQIVHASSFLLVYRGYTRNGTIANALPPKDEPVGYASDSEEDEDNVYDTPPSSLRHSPKPEHEIENVLIQCDDGAMMVRTLQSGLLLIAIASTATTTLSSAPHSNFPSSQSLYNSTNGVTRDISQLALGNGNGSNKEKGKAVDTGVGTADYAPSMSSVNASGGGGVNLSKLKRKVAGLATWLNDELGDYRTAEEL